VAKELGRYAIGEKLRKLRLKKKIGLVEVGQHSGLSPALISKIKRGRIYPTLSTLLRLALVFGVGLEHFFREDQLRSAFAIVRQADRQRFPDDPDQQHVSYFFESLDFEAVDRKLDAYLAHFELPPESGEIPRHEHPGVEFIYIISGILEPTHDDSTSRLEAGDSVYFDSSVPHGYSRVGDDPCTAVVVAVPSAG
jgi:transcriptional regulator with XRE-family HTH domain